MSDFFFAMEPRKELPLTPGARAVVKVSLQGNLYSDGIVVPVKALVGDENDGFAVWVYDDGLQTVNQQKVDVKHIEGELAIVEGPISLGQQVVAAGAAQMRENMKVLPYKGEK